jgi:hypothetical protein
VADHSAGALRVGTPGQIRTDTALVLSEMTPAKLVYGGVSGAAPGIRTPTDSILNRMLLPVEREPQMLVAPAGIEPRIPDLRGRFP